jgi:hypothetical protein
MRRAKPGPAAGDGGQPGHDAGRGGDQGVEGRHRPNSKPVRVDVVRTFEHQGRRQAWNVTARQGRDLHRQMAGEQEADAGDHENGQDVGGENPSRSCAVSGTDPKMIFRD